MTIAQGVIFFCIAWWMLLLLMLPFGSKMADKKQAGHAASAPERTYLKKKLKLTTLFCLLITLGAYSFANAKSTYTTDSGCASLVPHQPNASARAEDGKNQHGNAVPPATMGTNHSINKQLEYIDIPVEIPLSNYSNSAANNTDLSDTRIRPGTITVDTINGEARFNGVNLSDAPLYNPDCVRNNGSIYSTK